MPIGNGGIIGPANVPTITTASGVWSLREQQQAQGRGAWPLAIAPDPYFEYTTLLLPGNGTNGANNNTFLDSSTNNFNITRNGNTTQGTFSPFSQTGWGNYFDGSGDCLTAASNAAFNLSSNAFCVETWFYPTASSGQIVSWSVSSTGIEITLASGTVTLDLGSGSSWFITAANCGTAVLNAWNHIAIVKNSSGNIGAFLNGTRNYSTTNTTAVGNANTFVSIGSNRGTSNYFTGYLSNFRYVNGSAVYNPTQTTITVPTAPLTAITNTSLLTCQSNRFVDNSSNAFTITVNGNTSVVAFSPFNPTLPWIASINGGSGYFDGNADYLSVADNANLRFGTSAFTIQAWIYRNASGTAHSIIAKGGASTGYVLQVTSTNVLRFTHGTTNVDTTTTIPASAWTHVAAVRTNTSTNGFQLYINGVSSATATVSTDFNQTDTLYIGGDRSAANVMNGYISGLKYTNGTAETISVPTEPPTATTNVALLTNFTNAGIYDATGKNNIETVNDARISTAITPKWGNGSILLEPSVGSAQDYLLSSAPLSELAFLNNGLPWTIEGWFYTGSTSYQTILSTNAATATIGITISINETTTRDFGCTIYRGVGGSYHATASSGSVWSLSTWTYFAVVLDASKNLTVYINGSQVATTSASSFGFSSSNPTYPLVIGRYQAATPGAYFNGYLQDIRITRGIARTITTPTSAFPTL